MSLPRRKDLTSPADYLAAELQSSVKHEYLGGMVYAMSGASNRHNRIATNITAALLFRLRGRRCQAFNSDAKVRIQLPTHTLFYYPDAMVVCQPNPEADSFQDAPTAIVEVLSSRTRRTDEGEKRQAYLTIPSLRLYLLVEQDSAEVVVLRRAEQGFLREVHQGLTAVIAMPELDCELPLEEIYERVDVGIELPSED
jgi:Uma2 family endonuclease